MAEFKSWKSYSDFARAVRQESRYVRDPDSEDFLRVVRETSKSRIEILGKGKLLWRAQLGCTWHEYQPAPYGPCRMRPLADCAKEGRANPKGIPYLYTSTVRDTALAETRPWGDSYISLAQLQTARELRVVNCTTAKKNCLIYVEEPEGKEKEEAVWRDIDRAFSQPVTRTEDRSEYVGTQILAELFKADELDGIAYRSSLGQGHNIVLFDLNAAEPVNCCSLFSTTSIAFEFTESGNPIPIAKRP